MGRNRGGIVAESKYVDHQPSSWARQDDPSDVYIEDVDYIWSRVQQVIRECVDTTKYTTWFEPLKPMSMEDGTVCIAVPNKFVRSWLMEHYHTLIVETVQQLVGAPYQVTFVVQEPEEGHSEADQTAPSVYVAPSPTAAPVTAILAACFMFYSSLEINLCGHGWQKFAHPVFEGRAV